MADRAGKALKLATRLKDRVADLLCHPWVGRLLRVMLRDRIPSLRFGGGRLATDSLAVADRTVAQIFWGIYESAELRFVASTLRSDLDAIELGSSLGSVSCAVARKLEPGRRLVCVEANPALIPLLERNVAANAPDTDVRVLNRAVAYGYERVRFVAGDRSTAGRTVGASAEAEGVDVPASSLSALLAENAYGEYVLISDIEGAELAYIANDAEALARCQQIVMELHDVEVDGGIETVDAMLAALTGRHGFVLRVRHGPVCVLDRPRADAMAGHRRP